MDYDIDADGALNPPEGDWSQDQEDEHTIRLSPNGMYWWENFIAYAWYKFDFGNRRPLKEIKFGVYYKTESAYGSGPTIYLYNWETEGFVSVRNNLGQKSDYSWKELTVIDDENYRDNPNYVIMDQNKFIKNGKIWTMIYADNDDDILLNKIRIKITEQPPPPEAEVDVSGSLKWENALSDSTVRGNIYVENDGESNSLLNWTVKRLEYDYYTGGSFTFSPSSGTDLKVTDPRERIQVSIPVHSSIYTTHSGKIVVYNIDDPPDCEIVDVSVTTPKNLAFQTYKIFNIFNILKNILPNWFILSNPFNT
jgi:hypothetical protein